MSAELFTDRLSPALETQAMPRHAHSQSSNNLRPHTAGRPIHWAWAYDGLTQLLTVGQERRLRARTIALASLLPAAQVLDVGCGTGSLTLLAKQHVGPAGFVCGLDASPEMIQTAQRKARRAGVKVDFRLGVAEALPFPDGAFDVVLSSLMMHHLPDELKRAGLREINRVLRPGGRLVIVDARRPTGRLDRVLYGLMLPGGLASGIEDVAALMLEAGFDTAETGSLLSRHIGYAWTRRT